MKPELREEIERVQKEYGKEILKFNKSDWMMFTCTVKLSEDFIRHFANQIPWRYVCSNQKLSESFLEEPEIKQRIMWEPLTVCQDLSEDFIRKNYENIPKKELSHFQKLSMEFIREFADDLDWVGISRGQDLSYDFLKEFQNRIDLKEFAERNEMRLLTNLEKRGFENLRKVLQIL